jgi:lipopolysaccharide transport system ATP-binding protein
MSAIITVENLSKAYLIGMKDQVPDTLMSAATNWIKSPLRNFRNLRRLNTFDHDGETEDIIWAVKDISFEVQEGEAVGIIGRNGAGKSTLLKILSRITEPTGGRAVIRGRISSLLEVGTGFHPDLTGRENVYMNGTILGMTKREIDRKFDEIVDFSGVEKFLDTPIKRYSSGMQVRLAFSVAAHLEPEILIIDEVLAVGDAEFQKKCLGKMHDVASQGRTVLFVSHNLAAVSNLCTRGILLAHGLIVADEEATTICARYAASFDARNDGLTDLRSHKGRWLRDKSPVIQSITLKKHDGVVTRRFISEESMYIELELDSIGSLKVSTIHIVVADSNGLKLFTLGTDISAFELDHLTGRSIITCYLKTLPLNEGTYYIGLAVARGNEWIEGIDNAGSFEVQLVGGSKRTASLNRSHGPMLVDPIWSYTTV